MPKTTITCDDEWASKLLVFIHCIVLDPKKKAGHSYAIVSLQLSDDSIAKISLFLPLLALHPLKHR
jgi:hypothetical protein